MADAADAWARGRAVQHAPVSLRLWALGKANPGVLSSLSVLDEDPRLLAEFEAYAAAEAREAHRRAVEKDRAGRASRKVAGRRR